MNNQNRSDDFSDGDINSLFDQQDVDIPSELSDKIRSLATDELQDSKQSLAKDQKRFKYLAPVFASAAVLVLAVAIVPVLKQPAMQLPDQPELASPASVAQETELKREDMASVQIATDELAVAEEAEAPALVAAAKMAKREMAGDGAGSELTRQYRETKQTWIDEMKRLFEIGDVDLLAEELAEFSVEHGTADLVKQLPEEALQLLREQ